MAQLDIEWRIINLLLILLDMEVDADSLLEIELPKGSIGPEFQMILIFC